MKKQTYRCRTSADLEREQLAKISRYKTPLSVKFTLSCLALIVLFLWFAAIVRITEWFSLGEFLDSFSSMFYGFASFVLSFTGWIISNVEKDSRKAHNKRHKIPEDYNKHFHSSRIKFHK